MIIHSTWFDARKIILSINDNENDPTKLDSTKIDNYKETNKKVIRANLTKIRKTKRKPLESVILRKSVRFSNNLKDAVRTICQVCQASVTLLTMRSHTRNKHNMDIKEYRNEFGDPKNQMVEVVKHRCGICSEELLLHCDVITPHVKKHNITHSEYTRKYMVLSITRNHRADSSMWRHFHIIITMNTWKKKC